MGSSQQEPQAWTWPERQQTGSESSPGSRLVDQQQLQPQQPSPLQPFPGETTRSFAIRSALIATATSMITVAVAFGTSLTGEQAVAIIGAVTALSALVALVVSTRRGG